MNPGFCVAPLLAVVAGMLGANSAHSASVISGAYYENTVSLNCPNASPCRINFDMTPAGDKLVLLQHVACSFTSKAILLVSSLNVSSQVNGSGSRPLYLPTPAPAAAGGHNYYVVNDDIDYKLGAGRFPYITFVATTATPNPVISCTITGQIVDQ